MVTNIYIEPTKTAKNPIETDRVKVMSALDDLSKIADFGPGLERAESLISKFNIPINHFEFDYVEKCSDGRELEKILQVLRSGEEGHYPDLLKCTENRLRFIKPKSRYLREACPVLEKRDLSKDELKKISTDLENFVVTADKRDKELESRKVKTLECDVEVRKCNQEQEQSEEKKANEKRIASTDYESWNKYDPDTELLKMDIEEEKQKKEVIENQEKEKRAKPKKSVTFNRFATEAEAAFAAEREREKGNEFFKTGDYEEALRCYTASIQSKATVNNLNNRAVTLLKLKRNAEAVKDCDRVLTLEKGNVKAHMRKTEALEKLGRFEEALENIEFVIYKDANNCFAQELADKIRKQCDTKLKNTRMKIIEIE